MPDRPNSPNLVDIISKHGRAIRELQRTRPGKIPPKDDSYIEVWDDGEPQGLFKMLDFIGPSLLVNPTGDGTATVTVTSQDVGFDAIVDGAAAESDPESLLFRGIGEALDYLYNTVGLTDSCCVGVRPYPGTEALGYVELADWDMPTHTRLVGLRGVGPLDTDGPYLATWTWNGFRPTLQSNLQIENFGHFQPRTYTGASPLSSLVAYNTYFDMGGIPATALCANFIGYDCTFDYPSGAASPTFSSGSAVFVQCDISLRAAFTTFRFVANAGHLVMLGCRVAGTATLPTNFYLDLVSQAGNRAPVGTGRLSVTVPASAVGLIRSHAAVATVTASANFTSLELQGSFQTVTATGTHTALNIDGDVANNPWDIRGPATLSATASGTARFTIRGKAVVGTISGSGLSGSTTFVDFVDGDESALLIAADGTGKTGKPYAFDASSANNVLVFAKGSSFSAAGTDAGTNNRVLPEGAAPPAAGFAPADADYLVGTANGTLTSEIVVGTTPGGELGNTWASPTVDATHSGSAHADFIAKAFMDAKGDIITASADNTPVILTVGTNGFVLVADSTQASGLKWVSAGSLFTPTAGWGSITNVTPDKVYDADATTIDELADVLGTLVANLVAQGILAS